MKLLNRYLVVLRFVLGLFLVLCVSGRHRISFTIWFYLRFKFESMRNLEFRLAFLAGNNNMEMYNVQHVRCR
jgi:hypothetical protein